jgi:small-conductance mechanosensitive channel
VVAAFWQFATPIFGLPHNFMMAAGGASAVALAVGIVWGGWQFIDLIGHYVSHAGRAGAIADEIVTPLAIGCLRALLVCLALVYVADALSIPYSGLVAGLGISGLALAFASKETLSNIFGAAILVIDRPFKRGDSISVGDTKGVVEHVGIRSTRIRTSEDSLIVLPNGKLSDATINNLGTRRSRLTTATLILPYTMTPDAVADFVAAVTALVAAIPEVVPGRVDVSVSALTPSGMQLDVACYVLASSSTAEKAVRQSLMLDLVRLGDSMGVPVGPGHVPRLPQSNPAALAAE